MRPLKELINDVFVLKPDYNEMSVDEIALEICLFEDCKDLKPDELKPKVVSFMNNSVTKTVKGKRVEDKNSPYERVKNGKGGYKKGVYRLRKIRKVTPKSIKVKPIVNPVNEPVQVSTSFLGAAGEMAVCGELLFREYNVSQMSVDDGIDIVAMKNNKTFYIQVKTVQVKSDGFSVSIRSKSYDKYDKNDCYYIIVARGENTQFIVATADDIRRLIDKKLINKGDNSFSLRFTQRLGILYVGDEDVNYMIGSFERIK